MLTLFATFFGFLSSLAPEIIKFFQDKRDKTHELELMKLQQDFQEKMANKEASTRIEISENSALIEEIKRLGESAKPIGIAWVDSLNASVRPIIAYAFFLLYALVKILQFNSGIYWQMWNEEDQAIFAGIISFYFGSRLMQKSRRS